MRISKRRNLNYNYILMFTTNTETLIKKLKEKTVNEYNN